MIHCIYQAKAFLNYGNNFLADQVVFSAAVAVHHAMADLSLAISGVCSQSLQQKMDHLFYDPVSTSTLLAMIKQIESVTGFLGERKPIAFQKTLAYLDRSFISANQRLHMYAKRVHELLCVPENIKMFLRGFSFESFFHQMKRTTPSYLIWTNYLVIQLNRCAIEVLNLAIRILDLLIRVSSFGLQREFFGSLKRRIAQAHQNLRSQLAESVVEMLESKEANLRRQVVGNIARNATRLFFRHAIYLSVTSLVGMALYLPTKDLLKAHLGAPEWAVHTAALAVFVFIGCNSVVRSNCNLYFESYDPAFVSESISMWEFSKKFGIQAFYPITAFVSRLFGPDLEKARI